MKKKQTLLKLGKWLRFKMLTALFLCSFSLSAQVYYQPQLYDPNIPPSPGLLGSLFNPETYKIINAPTIFHGNQTVYTTAYLPFIAKEYHPNYPIELFGPNYTTGIALRSPKDPSLKLYAPIEVVSGRYDATINAFRTYAFATSLPYDPNGGPNANYQGPFNTYVNLNGEKEGFVNPNSSIAGISALEAIQKFTDFSHTIFGWNGYDKMGNVTIRAMVDSARFSNLAEYQNDKKLIVYHRSMDGTGQIFRSLTGHEMGHGIVAHSPNYETDQSASKRELDEGFADIMGIAFYNWMTDSNFVNLKWNQMPEYYSSDVLSSEMAYPIGYNSPQKYLGWYYQQDPTAAGYDEHINGSVLKFWFYLVNNYVDRYMEDDPNQPRIFTTPLILNDPKKNYKETLNILFKTFTEKLSKDADYPELRAKSLEVASEMNHPPNSFFQYMMKQAWHDVGVGPEPDMYNLNCGITDSGESWFNAVLTFSAQEFTNEASSNSSKANRLIDCSKTYKISTDEYLPQVKGSFTFTDVEGDGIFGIDNNLDYSKSAVAVHAFTQETVNWLKDKFNYDGIDGTGTQNFDNVLGFPGITDPVFDGIETRFLYPYNPKFATIDEVSGIFMRAVHYFAKNDTINNPVNYEHPEWQALRNGISKIFSLNIKNTFYSSNSLPGVWTLGETIPNDPYFLNFSNPGLTVQPKLYHGLNWNDIEPKNNASLLAFWYYLLVNGTEGYGPQGYLTEKGKTYFVFPVNNDRVLNIIWKAYQLVPLHGTFEDFRAATFQALQQLGYNDKKDFIALYDAWSAVMDQPDYAATLAHTPNDGEVVYAWPAKLGVEVEYPLLESSRIFEVSESATFNEQTAPVFRFFNYAAPDLQTGMTFARVNLKPGKTYYWRSHLYTSGSNAIGVGGACDNSSDPAFCLSLQGKEKWTPTYSFVTAAIDGPDEPSPAPASVAPAWDTPFSWSSILGAHGYLLKIGDDGGLVPMQDFELDMAYDEDVAKSYYNLALSKDKHYTYTLTARAKLGSDQGAKAVFDPVLKLTTYIPLSAAEKAAFPDAYGEPTEPITFKTDIPKMELVSPEDHVKVSPLESITLTAAPDEDRADFYRGRVYYQQGGGGPYGYEDQDHPSRTVKVKDLPYLANGMMYAWDFSPKKNKVLPFIPQEESGETPAPRHFIIDNNLIPQPGIVPVDCVNHGADVVLQWFEVPGAEGYKYVVTNALNPDVALAEGMVEGALQTSPLAGLSAYPGKYKWSVRAGYKNHNGDWEWGLYSLSEYMVRPPAPVGLSPNNATVSFIPNSNNSVTLNWTAVPGVENYHLALVNLNTNTVVYNQTVGNVTNITLSGLDWDTNYSWTANSINVLEPNNIKGCISGTNANFTTEKEPMKVIPELGFTYFIKDCDDFGICWPDVSYDLTVTAPNGAIVFKQDDMISNTNLAEYPFLQSVGAFDGKLQGPVQEGFYTLKCKITKLGNNAPKLGVWALTVTAMDLWKPLHNQGPAEQIVAASNLGQIAIAPGTVITIKFKYDGSSNVINLQ